MLATGDIFEFEDFRLDGREGLSRRDPTGAFVPLSVGIWALEVLGCWSSMPANSSEKEEIMAAVWGRAVVDNANLTVQIAALRRILDQGRAEGSCIQTVMGRGYRFSAESDNVPARSAVQPVSWTRTRATSIDRRAAVRRSWR